MELLEIKGCLVTIDAMGCQRNIAEQIVTAEADYVLAVKDNQPKLCEASAISSASSWRTIWRASPIAGARRMRRDTVARTIGTTIWPSGRRTSRWPNRGRT